jgi:hypothetical protein
VDGRRAASLNQLAGGMGLLAAPLRFAWGMLVWAVFLLLSPLLIIATLGFGARFMSADDIALTRVLLAALAALAPISPA